MNAYTLQDVKLSYDNAGASPQLQIEYLAIAENTLTIIIGENGCGKTTLLNMLAIIGPPPQQGQITLLESNVLQHRLSKKQRHHIGYLLQTPYLMKGSVLFNLTLPGRAYGLPKGKAVKKAMELLEKFQLIDWHSKNVLTLSQGQQKKVALLRLFCMQHKILLLDEGFSHLDADFSKRVWEELDVRKQYQTILLSTHTKIELDSSSVNWLQLHQGKIVNKK